MVANHIHHALSQVQELRHKILEKQRFKGYSGRARALSGTLAFIAAVWLSLPYSGQNQTAHLLAWSIVFAASLLLNFGAMLYWFLFDPSTKRDIRKLRPVVDILPPLIVGGVLTVVMMLHNLYDLLFGIWMALFGLANLSARHTLPRKIWIPGLLYIVSGSFFLIFPLTFLNPWPMGIVFLIGEWATGVILHFDEDTPFSIRNFLSSKGDFHVET